MVAEVAEAHPEDTEVVVVAEEQEQHPKALSQLLSQSENLYFELNWSYKTKKLRVKKTKKRKQKSKSKNTTSPTQSLFSQLNY